MYKSSKDKMEIIIRLYKEGVLLTEICKQTSSSQPTVKTVLLHAGIDYNSERQLSRNKLLHQIVDLYTEGYSQLYIEKYLGVTRKTVREVLKESGVQYRTKSEQHHLRWGQK